MRTWACELVVSFRVWHVCVDSISDVQLSQWWIEFALWIHRLKVIFTASLNHSVRSEYLLLSFYHECPAMLCNKLLFFFFFLHTRLFLCVLTPGSASNSLILTTRMPNVDKNIWEIIHLYTMSTLFLTGGLRLNYLWKHFILFFWPFPACFLSQQMFLLSVHDKKLLFSWHVVEDCFPFSSITKKVSLWS